MQALEIFICNHACGIHDTHTYILGLCDNRNSHVTIMLLDIMIITIVDPLLYVCMKFIKALLNAPIVFFIICYPLFPVLS